MELKVFQSDCASLIANRYAFFANHPDRPRKGSNKPRPFFQALSALTGAGKTPVLAQAVALMRGCFGCEPIVLWMSKARSVVAQTFTNFSTGGKYSEIIDGFRVITTASLAPHLLSDGTTPLIVMTTTGLFNNKDQSEGNLNIYQKDDDLFGDTSPWDRLIQRLHEGKRRPLVIVYDEGHNLSEQQTELLAELEPEAYLLASATLRLPSNFQKSVIQPIRLWIEELTDTTPLVALRSVGESGTPEAELFITTAVNSAQVVESQLVKKAIQFDGTTANMERCLDDLTGRLALLTAEIEQRRLRIKPKAIYVCKTNIADDGEKDDASLPFHLRKAPPIRIWRYLVEQKGISPKNIAIYAHLAFVEGNKPDEVNLFSKGDNDFDMFQAGDFQHIIFNLSLQEGWDDPSCYLAYIDKSMGSSIHVEQIIGRVLRQYGATHYETPLLNTAHFFLRVDSKGVFTETIEKVKAKLQSEGAPIEITSTFGAAGGTAEDLHPKEGVEAKLHHVFVDSEAARTRIADIINDFPSFSEGDENTVGEAHTARQIVSLEAPNADSGAVQWQLDGHTNPMRLRWLVNTAIKSRSSRALAIVDLKDPKFDVRVQIQSKADKLAEKTAREVVSAFYDLSELSYESTNSFAFGTLRVPKAAPTFENGLYERYTGLSKTTELPFAKALDEAGVLWHRNPSAGGFHIPLLSEGQTSSFYPDFIVWVKGLVLCLDTKGAHLLSDAIARKLFDIKEDGRTKLSVRLITEGRQTELRGKVTKGGYTVWRMKTQGPAPVYVDDIHAAVAESLRK
jgi:type III restriction enzyme